MGTSGIAHTTFDQSLQRRKTPTSRKTRPTANLSKCGRVGLVANERRRRRPILLRRMALGSAAGGTLWPTGWRDAEGMQFTQLSQGCGTGGGGWQWQEDGERGRCLGTAGRSRQEVAAVGRHLRWADWQAVVHHLAKLDRRGVISQESLRRRVEGHQDSPAPLGTRGPDQANQGTPQGRDFRPEHHKGWRGKDLERRVGPERIRTGTRHGLCGDTGGVSQRQVGQAGGPREKSRVGALRWREAGKDRLPLA